MPKNFYEQKIEILRDVRSFIDDALSAIDQAIDHEEQHGDSDSIDGELRPIEDRLTDVANYIDRLLDAVEPLYNMECRANKIDEENETRIK